MYHKYTYHHSVMFFINYNIYYIPQHTDNFEQLNTCKAKDISDSGYWLIYLPTKQSIKHATDAIISTFFYFSFGLELESFYFILLKNDGSSSWQTMLQFISQLLDI